MSEQKIDFTKIEGKLLSGRKNGERAHKLLGIKLADGYKFVARQEQLITSSYFLGLMSNELKELSSSIDIEELMARLDTTDLNEKSKNECTRAIRRSITTARAL
ncbi:hypothetical protein FB440_12451 [Vibrio crassostreae]|uniref:hypothetical protein n=1 Tax=Vibrio crassostreae TaxID=246167 RepID=UPI0011991221|nr:hypothetical protein [Vibrio crassostreae]TWD32135.1 hypothetical protein FB440_12451 [Vibrio crassostreae]